jgi:GNAT superfamily N-acetyltransferase
MMEPMDEITIRSAGPADVPAALGLMEGAARWLVARGRPGQWGTAPQATDPRRIATFTAWAEAGELYLAAIADEPVGALAVGAAPDHVPPASEPELYVNLLVTDRARAGRGIGRMLLDHARTLARQRGLGRLRVDCYGGDDRALVRYYEREGFTATEPFTVETSRGPWPGQLLEERIALDGPRPPR